MSAAKPSKATSGKYSDLSRDDQKLVEQRYTALAEINRQRALAVEAHFDLVRRGFIDFRQVADCW
jgi:hypothetical protein